jgi:hypothetical protein
VSPFVNSGDFVAARVQLVAPTGVRATLLVDSSLDGYDENGFKLGPPRRKERAKRAAGMRPELDQRLVDAWLFGSRLEGLREVVERIERGSAEWLRKTLLDMVTRPVGWQLSEGERLRLDDLPEVRR